MPDGRRADQAGATIDTLTPGSTYSVWQTSPSRYGQVEFDVKIDGYVGGKIWAKPGPEMRDIVLMRE